MTPDQAEEFWRTLNTDVYNIDPDGSFLSYMHGVRQKKIRSVTFYKLQNVGSILSQKLKLPTTHQVFVLACLTASGGDIDVSYFFETKKSINKQMRN